MERAGDEEEAEVTTILDLRKEGGVGKGMRCRKWKERMLRGEEREPC